MASATPVAEIRCEWPDVGQALPRSITGRFVTATDYDRIRTAGFRVRRIATGRPRLSPRSARVVALAAGRILLRNVYGWFERTERGVYRLNNLLRWPTIRSVRSQLMDPNLPFLGPIASGWVGWLNEPASREGCGVLMNE